MPAFIHPATLDTAALLAECDVRRQRRSGPGGQHRNKVETAVVIVHRPTGVRGEGSETRSQADNRSNAIQRLRVKLALAVRSPEFAIEQCPSTLWRSRLRGEQITVSAQHADFPILLAEAIDCIAAYQYDFPLAAEKLGCSSSQLIKLLKLEFEALEQVNEQRKLLDLRPLR